MSYVETLMATYPQFNLWTLFHELPLVAGLALLEARRCRLDPRGAIGYVDRCVMRANAETKAWFEARFDIVERPAKGGAR